MRKVITVLGTRNLLLMFLKNRLTEWVLSLRIEMEYAVNLSHVRLIGRSLLVFMGQFNMGGVGGAGRFPHSSSKQCSGHQLGVLQLNSLLTLSAGIHRLRFSPT